MTERFDWIVVGASPAGQAAAIQAARAGYSVALVERDPSVGAQGSPGRATPSKALREAADRPGVTIARLLGDTDHGSAERGTDRLTRSGVVLVHGEARFEDAHHLSVLGPHGRTTLAADHFVVATRSVPVHPRGVLVDRARVFDTDSILGVPALPTRMAVLGGGVSACELATTFQRLGTQVTWIDKASWPLGFLERALVDHLMADFERHGGRFVPETTVVGAGVDADGVQLELLDGSTLDTETVLVAVGRVADVHRLDLERLGVELTTSGHVAVDHKFRTSVPHVLAVGDTVGHGRRAVRLALRLPVEAHDDQIPLAIHSVPELASIGLSEAGALAAHDSVRVGVGHFGETVRGRMTRAEGLVKIVASACGKRLLGVHVAGEGAADLVHIGQMAMIGGLPPSVFVDSPFDLPTLTEAYRVAARALQDPSSVRSSLAPA